MKRLIACKIFAAELSAVMPEEHKDIDITWIDAGLHSNLDQLEARMKEALASATADGAEVCVLIGSGCHPDMCQMVDHGGGKILGAKNCLDAFCPGIVEEQAAEHTMVVTPTWIRLYRSFMETAGGSETDVRMEVGRYDRILLIESEANVATDEEILEFFDLTQVPIETQKISLDHFRTRVNALLHHPTRMTHKQAPLGQPTRSVAGI